MKKVAIVVQRCHESVVGGSENLAWQYASLLKDAYEVDVLTTTAVDAAYWSNVLREGLEIREGINIRRFRVDIGYSPYRTELFERMLEDFKKSGAGRQRGAPNGKAKHIPWSIPLQEEFIRRIGPHSAALSKFLRDNWSNYRAIIFVTYLYPTAYFGMLEVPRGRALFAPTLHDEQPAYLSVYKYAALRMHSLIWLTDAERRLGHDVWGELPGSVVGMAIDSAPREPLRTDTPYLLYCGRIDPNKGCAELFDYFIRFKADYPSSLRLVLTGIDDISIPDHPDIEFRGFVSEEEKFRLMAGAITYVMPSARESFSIVTLEAMAQRTPALVNSQSDVLFDHMRDSGGGRIYQDYENFAARLGEILSDEDMAALMGKLGREYVTYWYTPERVRQSLIEAVESCPEVGESVEVAVKHGTSLQGAAFDSLDEDEISDEISDEPKHEYLSSSPPLPLPSGWSEEALFDLVSSVQVEDAPSEELKTYVQADFKRFVYTLGLVPERSNQTLLELGANPYFTTTLLSKFRNADLHLANFFDHAEPEGSQRVTIHKTKETFTYNYKHFNIEKDAFPYEDDTFDVVLFCEIIEHLLFDPVHALVEIKRVLKPGGILVLTTPNVVRLDNVRKIIGGENVYDPYSGYGPYGRHNREYTQEDLFSLLSVNGFTVSTMFTADVNPGHTSSSVPLEKIAPLVRHRQTDLGQYIFCQSSVNQAAKHLPPVRPDWLYRSMPEQSDSTD
jgi:glycosyltransferase involved in cell wall biosynthesis/SAM-dependent methyltransferase